MQMMSPRTPSKGAECGKCNKLVRSSEKGLICDFCDQWFHAGCDDVSQDLYRFLQKFEDQMWSCKQWKPRIKEMRTENETLKKENSELKQIIVDLKDQLNNMKVEIANDVTERVLDRVGNLRDLEERMETREANLVSKAVEVTMNRLQEKEEKDKRRKNLVLYNIKESGKEMGAERQAEDTVVCKEIFQVGLGLNPENFNVEGVFRLGGRISGEDGQELKPRPVLVKLGEERVKWHILSKAKELSKSLHVDWKKVRISPDLTRQEREENRLLREELMRKRAEGGNWIIKKGKVIPIIRNEGEGGQ